MLPLGKPTVAECCLQALLSLPLLRPLQNPSVNSLHSRSIFATCDDISKQCLSLNTLATKRYVPTPLLLPPRRRCQTHIVGCFYSFGMSALHSHSKKPCLKLSSPATATWSKRNCHCLRYLSAGLPCQTVAVISCTHCCGSDVLVSCSGCLPQGVLKG